MYFYTIVSINNNETEKLLHRIKEPYSSNNYAFDIRKYDNFAILIVRKLAHCNTRIFCDEDENTFYMYSGEKQIPEEVFNSSEFTKKLKSPFSLLFLNKNTNELSVYTDLYASYPVFYAYVDGMLLCTNDYRVFPNVGYIDFNKRWLTSFWTLTRETADYTMLEGVRKMPAATHTRFKNGRMKRQRKYTSLCVRQNNKHSRENILNKMDCVLNQAVMPDDKSESRLGVELSSGIDSGAILAYLLKANRPEDIETFSHVGAAKNYLGNDEYADIQQLTAYYKLKNTHYFTSETDRLLKLFSDTIDILGYVPQQYFEVFSIPFYRETQTNGIKYLYSGFGGDQCLSNRNNINYKELFLNGYYLAFIKRIRVRSKGKLKKIIKLIISLLLDATIYKISPNLFAITHRRNFDELDIHGFLNKKYSQSKSLKKSYLRYVWNNYLPRSVNKRVRFLLQQEFISERLQIGHSFATHFDFFYKYPLLMEAVVKYYLATPNKIKLGVGRSRVLIRELIKDKVPQFIYEKRNKSGAAVPSAKQRLVNQNDELLEFLTWCEKNRVGSEYYKLNQLKTTIKEMRSMTADNFHTFPRVMNHLALLVYLAKKAGKVF